MEEKPSATLAAVESSSESRGRFVAAQLKFDSRSDDCRARNSVLLPCSDEDGRNQEV